ncbi:hypothetical protein [Streptomyces buecherae]|uniref:hypothetical protein n=1 Tax=Streptomyces buecherae TaxID=2763006 RepID=UPI00369AE6E9
MRDELARTLADARARGDERDETEALTLAAMGAAYEGNTAPARDHARAATALADVLTDADLAGRCESLVRPGWSEVFPEPYADAERHAEHGGGRRAARWPGVHRGRAGQRRFARRAAGGAEPAARCRVGLPAPPPNRGRRRRPPG